MSETYSKELTPLKLFSEYYRIGVSVLFGYSFLLSFAFLKGYWSFFGWNFIDFYSVSEIAKSSIIPSGYSFLSLVVYSAVVYSIPRLFRLVVKRENSDEVARFAGVLGMTITIFRNRWIGENTVPILAIILLLSVVVAFVSRSKLKFINGLYIAFFSMLPLLSSYYLGTVKADDVIKRKEYRYLDAYKSDFGVPERYYPLKYIAKIGNRIFFVADDNTTLVTIQVDGVNFILRKGVNDKKPE
ncbi:hypothetical protein ACR42D_17430 [Desulfovibrio caledoniensis]